MTLSPSCTSSVGPGIMPLYAKTSLGGPGTIESRAGAAVSVTSTVCGSFEAFTRTAGLGNAAVGVGGFSGALLPPWCCPKEAVAPAESDRRHHRGVDHPKPFYAVHAKAWIDYAHWIRSHSACSHRMPDRLRFGSHGRGEVCIARGCRSRKNFSGAQGSQRRRIDNPPRDLYSGYGRAHVMTVPIGEKIHADPRRTIWVTGLQRYESTTSRLQQNDGNGVTVLGRPRESLVQPKYREQHYLHVRCIELRSRLHARNTLGSTRGQHASAKQDVPDEIAHGFC